jgi:hypothetical protein
MLGSDGKPSRPGGSNNWRQTMDTKHRAGIERLQELLVDFMKHYDDLPPDYAADKELYQALGAVLYLVEPRLGRWRREASTG